MSVPITSTLVDREQQHALIAKMLDRIQNRESPFTALEFYGIAGIGKSRILDMLKAQLRQRNLPFAVIDFLPFSKHALEFPEIDLLMQICDQLDRHFSTFRARSALQQSARLVAARSEKATTERMADAFLEFRLRLAEALSDSPLILMFDSIEHCPESLFDWLGQEFIAPMVVEGQLSGIALFLAGRGPRVNESHWLNTLKRATQSFRLDPLDFAATEEHLGALPPEGRYRQAAKEIYALSNGHPYSTEAIVYWLNRLGVKVEAVGARREDLARRLYDEVIDHYILADAAEWALPLVEIASVFRWFNLGFLSVLVPRYRPEVAQGQPIQWYLARLVDLQQRPLHLVYVGGSKPAYELEPTLRKLLHTALVILNPDETVALHQESKNLYEDEMRSAPSALLMAEILYHTAQIAAIQGMDTFQPVHRELEQLLREYSQFLGVRESLILLKDLLGQDTDLNELLGGQVLADLAGLIDQFLKPSPIPSAPFRFSHLVIEHFPPTEFRVSWYQAKQVVLPTETVHSARKFTLEEWQDRTQVIGQVAFRSYLPTRAQDFMRTHRDWAIQLSTNWTDIPWELLHDEKEFLCLSRPIARKPKLLKEPKRYPEEPSERLRALVMGNPTGDLPGAEVEAQDITQMLVQAGIVVTSLIGPRQATANEFAIRIATERYDIIHYAGHGYFKPDKPHLSGLLFLDEPVFAEDLERVLNSRAFLFLSACEAAETKTEKATIGFRGEFIEGVAISALLGGAIGCLGPMWEIEDGLAKDFAVAFYEHLLTGQPIGEAVRQARLKLRDRSPDFWASWVLYGDPLESLLVVAERTRAVAPTIPLDPRALEWRDLVFLWREAVADKRADEFQTFAQRMSVYLDNYIGLDTEEEKQER